MLERLGCKRSDVEIQRQQFCYLLNENFFKPRELGEFLEFLDED